jgi:drug/metabolite transporter (DMT)-like permease
LLVAALTYTLVLPFVPRSGAARQPGDVTRLVVLGLTGAAGYHLAVNWGERFISAGLASLIVASMPAMVALLAAFFLRERLGPRGNAGVVLALAGVAVLAAAGEGGLNAESTTGALVTLLAPLAWAIYTIMSKPLAARYDGVRLNVVGAWVGTIIVLPIALPGVEELAELDAEGWFWLLYLGVVSTAAAYIAYAWALRHWTASGVATFIYLVPAASLLWAWVLLGEVPTLWAVLGGAIVVAGVVLVETAKQAHQRSVRSGEAGIVYNA